MRRTVLCSLLVLVSMVAAAQQAAIGFSALDAAIDFKSAHTGDKISLHLTRDLLVNGKVILPRGTVLTATITEATDAKSVSIALDKAKLAGGNEVPVMGIIAAVAAPPSNDLSRDPFYGMNHSTEATQVAGNAAQNSVATSGAAAQTAILKGHNEPKSNLEADSQGAIGIDSLSLKWLLDKPPAQTVFTSKKKNLKLPKGTELLLRMAPPQV